ncbi:MAG: GNAT family N-acetyltransferase [Gemmatimonadales bacterium]
MLVSFGLRPAVPADAAPLSRLRYEFRAALGPAAEDPERFLERCAGWMREHLATPGPWRCWTTEAGGGIAGMVWLQLVEKLPNPVAERELHAYITSLYVKPEHRDAGMGSALLGAALRECEDRRVDAVLLWPTPRSRSLYQRHRFGVAEDLLVRRLDGAYSADISTET